MVFFAQKLSYISEGGIRQLSAQIHYDLTGLYELGISLLGSNIFRLYAKMLCHYINNESRSDLLWLVGVDDILQGFFGQRESDLPYLIWQKQ